MHRPLPGRGNPDRALVDGRRLVSLRTRSVGPRRARGKSIASALPHGLRAISDYAHSQGIKTIVWFEPERVHPDTWLTKTHPEWIWGGAGGGLLKLGNPETRKWLTEHIDRLMTAEGIDLYRQDFNMDPLASWRAADAPDRQGITEIRHVEGYLAYWDELRKRHPDMYIDSCISGGRRNDLETMRHAIPLWRTDYRCEPVGTQCCSYGISLWLPFSGTGAADVDAYTFRSNMAPMTNCLFDVRNTKLDYELLRRLVAEWRELADCYAGDFYPLTTYNGGHDAWMAWQFDCPEKGQGVVQAFRREKCIFETGRLKLLGLDADSSYDVVDLDHGEPKQLSGKELSQHGLQVTIADQPGAVVITYKKHFSQGENSMMMRTLLVTVAAFSTVLLQSAWAVAPNADELAAARQWAAAKFEGPSEARQSEFFSFTYDGRPSSDLLKAWEFACRKARARRQTH